MAKEDFLISVRTAMGTVLPRADADHPYPDRENLEEIFRRSTSDLWLSRSAVAGFDRDDFQDLNPETRETLDRDVAAFLDVATKVNPKGPATTEQIEAALPPFLEIAEIVRERTLADWIGAARGLIDQADTWARAEEWPIKRYQWKLIDRFLGVYEVERLVYGVMGSQLALIPVGRYSAGSGGAFDLAVMPAYESVTVRRKPSGKWLIGPLPGEATSHRWKRESFVEVSKKLARMG